MRVSLGSRAFVQNIAEQLANDAKGRQVIEADAIFSLRDANAPYAGRSSTEELPHT